MKLCTTWVDKFFLFSIMVTVKSDDKASFVKPAFSEREMVRALSPRRKAATLEQSVRNRTFHPRYRMA